METVAALGVLAVVVEKVIERLRVNIPTLQGTAVTAVAVGLGFAAAWGWDLQGFTDILGRANTNVWVDYAFTGAAVGLGAGFVNDLTP
jgi:hypothetical protein